MKKMIDGKAKHHLGFATKEGARNKSHSNDFLELVRGLPVDVMFTHADLRTGMKFNAFKVRVRNFMRPLLWFDGNYNCFITSKSKKILIEMLETGDAIKNRERGDVVLISPLGERVRIKTLAEFCRCYSLGYINAMLMITGKEVEINGWRSAEEVDRLWSIALGNDKS